MPEPALGLPGTPVIATVRPPRNGPIDLQRIPENRLVSNCWA